MKLRQETNYGIDSEESDNEDEKKREVISNINKINSMNFKDFFGLGLKTLAMVILDYKLNIKRIREILVEYRFNFMHYELYPKLVLKIRMILDFFENMNVYSSQNEAEDCSVNKSFKQSNSGGSKIIFDRQKLKDEVTEKINVLLENYGQTEKSFIQKKIQKIDFSRDNTCKSKYGQINY